MSTSEVVISQSAVKAVPKDYTVSSSQGIIPLLITASLDGSGAATAYEATVEFINDAGVVMGRFPCLTSIAAGGSADVSWFPLRHSLTSTSPGTPYEDVILATAGLVLYWKLDEPSGTTVTDSSDSHDGVYQGGPTLGVPPLADVLAVTLDGTVPQTAELNTWPAQIVGIQANGQMSIEAWIKTTNPVGGYVAVSDTQDAGGRFFQFGVDGLSRPRFSIFGDDASGHTLIGTGNLADGVKHHIVGTFDGTTLNYYVDGVLNATTNPPMGGFPLAGDNHGFWVGARWTQGLGYDIAFTGTVDEVALYTLAMDAATVAAHFAAG